MTAGERQFMVFVMQTLMQIIVARQLVNDLSVLSNAEQADTLVLCGQRFYKRIVRRFNIANLQFNYS